MSTHGQWVSCLWGDETQGTSSIVCLLRQRVFLNDDERKKSMNSRKTLNILSVLSVLLIVGATVLAWSVNVGRQTTAHAATKLATLTEILNKDTYIFTRLPGTGPSAQSASIDTGPFTMTENGQTLGTIEAKVAVANSVRGPAGKYAYTVQMLSTVPDLAFSSSALDYPNLNISGLGDPAEFAESPYGQTAVKYSNLNYRIFSPDAVKDPLHNTVNFLTSQGAFGTGSSAFSNMTNLIDMQGTAFQDIENLVNPPQASVAQPATSTLPLSFHKPTGPLITPRQLRNMAGVGIVLGVLGKVLSAWLQSMKFDEQLLAVASAMIGEVSSLIIYFSGVALGVAHLGAILVLQQRQAIIATAAQALRNAANGVPYAAIHRGVDADIGAFDPPLQAMFNDEL
jgi:hypothetical protein